MRIAKFLFLAIAVFTASAVVYGGSEQWNCFPDAALTADQYWNHQPAAVRELRGIDANKDDSAPRAERAMELAKAGYTIDVAIMVNRYNPVCMMGLRLAQGFAWIPSALQSPILVMPGLVFPGLPSYDPAHPPEGSIKVSLDPKDYPLAADLQALKDEKEHSDLLKGAQVIGSCYSIGGPKPICGVGPAGFHGATGEIVTEGGKSYVAHVVRGLMGVTIWFEPQ